MGCFGFRTGAVFQSSEFRASGVQGSISIITIITFLVLLLLLLRVVLLLLPSSPSAPVSDAEFWAGVHGVLAPPAQVFGLSCHNDVHLTHAKRHDLLLRDLTCGLLSCLLSGQHHFPVPAADPEH